MTPLSIAYVATAAICVAVGLQHVVMARRADDRTQRLLFAMAAFAVAGDAITCIFIYRAETPQQLIDSLAWSGFFLLTAVTCLVWFIYFRTGAARRWLVQAETAIAVLGVVAGFTVGITYAQVTEFLVVELPWGEIIRRGIGPASPWRWLGDLANIGFLVVLIDTTVRLARRGERRASRVLGASMVIFSLALLLIIPADLGLISLPGPHTFAFLLIVAAMSWDLSEDLIRASRLTREVRTNERRWRQLLNDVHLLAARVDREGRVVAVNPHFTRVLGYTTEDVAGRESWDFVTLEQRGDRRSAHARAMSGEPTPEIEVKTTSKDGQQKHIVWRDVVLRDGDGEIEGMLSIGADMTDQLAAEADRDRVVEELELLKDRLEEENVYLREEIRAEHGFEDIVGSSDPLLYVLHKVRQVGASDTSVLILGETGVGKELIARTIHNESPRSSGPFVVVNCAALPPTLIESELFGHERGAFTGADRQRRGRFELAHAGTIFLDEVGELPLEMQPKLLRVLQEGEMERVGGSRTITVDVRVIAATNRDLREDMEAGRFREDLFYRIAVYPITVPPLRDRREDIPSLVEHFSQHFARRRGRTISEIPSEVMRRFESYEWPGNVRELQNVIERAVLTSTGGVLKLAEPLHNAAREQATISAEPAVGDGPLALDDVERTHIERVLASTGGKISGSGGAAEILGLHANTLRYRMKKLGIMARRKNGGATVDN